MRLSAPIYGTHIDAIYRTIYLTMDTIHRTIRTEWDKLYGSSIRCSNATTRWTLINHIKTKYWCLKIIQCVWWDLKDMVWISSAKWSNKFRKMLLLSTHRRKSVIEEIEELYFIKTARSHISLTTIRFPFAFFSSKFNQWKK